MSSSESENPSPPSLSDDPNYSPFSNPFFSFSSENPFLSSSSSNPSPSLASSSNPEFNGMYDIFLSFRGETRKKFTDHLYKTLLHEGFHTFRDDDEIPIGKFIKPELEKAIMNSRMSVIVLSQNYANSTACLFELQMILDRVRTSDHIVLPVFYEVDPWEIKEQAKNLDFGEKKVTVEEVKGWSAALSDVARMKGMVSQNQCDGYEAKFIEEIVGVLKIYLGKLDGMHLRVSDHLVGMYSRMEPVSLWLKDRSTGVGILLIRGMGGIGKTTIAKIVYNLNQRRYDATCFISNISEVAKGPKGLLSLQRQLLSDILRKKAPKVHDFDDGCRRIKYALRNKRVLLVLDDVNQTDQLSALAEQDWFSPGSKIIITSRHMSMMKDYKIDKVYRPNKLSIKESLELFSWHAFGQKHPSQGHMNLSKRFVQHCDGLPLALEVLGSTLRQKDMDVWESELQKFEAISDNTILGKLERSYDSLKDNHDRYLFLDIACFFAGKKKNDTITILEGCGYSALAGIQNLVDGNLLQIVNGKLEIMHQLLQDMAEQIVERESRHPEKRSRIWRPQESFDILLGKIGTETIESLVLDMNMLGNSNMVVFEANTFAKMYNLKLLKLIGVQFSGTYEAFPKRLRWLYWRDFSSEYLPNDFPMENLVALDMRDSNLKRFSTGTKVLGLLKILNLSHSPKLVQTPDFSRIPSLEKLVLKACPSLVEIDESVVILRRIESLNLQDCINLRKLPRDISMVESLVEIDISGCSNLMGTIEELEKMKSLQVLKASRTDINRLLTVEVVSQASSWRWAPKSRVQMSLASLPSSLVHLNLSHCNLTDDAFPGDLSKLSKLQHLFLGGNPISSLPNFIKDLTGIQTLDLSQCPNLWQIIWPVIGLEKLVVTECHALEKITSPTRTTIKSISHGGCFNLNDVQWVFKILPVKEVNLELINNIGFFNLDYMADVEAFIVNCLVFSRTKRPIQILYEENIFTAFFPGRQVPHWFSNKNGGSTISFTATSSPFRLILCLVYAIPAEREWLPYPLHFEINSERKRVTMYYTPRCYGIPEEGRDMVWLSHCFPVGAFTAGDEVKVSFGITGDGQIKECGIHPLYFEEEGEVSQYLSTIRDSWDSSFCLP